MILELGAQGPGVSALVELVRISAGEDQRHRDPARRQQAGADRRTPAGRLPGPGETSVRNRSVGNPYREFHKCAGDVVDDRA